MILNIPKTAGICTPCKFLTVVPMRLFSLTDRLADTTTSLNVTKPEDTIGIFKPYVRRLNPLPEIIRWAYVPKCFCSMSLTMSLPRYSDADAEIIVLINFTSPVHIRKMMVIGGNDVKHHPNEVKCYVNKDNVDFSSIQSFSPTQTFRLDINNTGTNELTTNIVSFTNVMSLALYFPGNHGDDDVTILKYIGFQGEHTHYRREAVNTVYELLCTGSDIHTESEAQLGMHHLH